MIKSQNAIITIRVNHEEKEKFRLLSKISNKPISKLLRDFVDNTLRMKRLTPLEIRELPKDLRAIYLQQISIASISAYNKYKDELFIEELGDGIE